MKSISLSIIILAICTASFGQKAKIKKKNFVYSYQVYPELSNFENTKTFSINIIDENNESYSYSEGNTEVAKSADVYIPLGLAYGFKWIKTDNDLIFQVTQTSSIENDKELLTFEDPATKAKKFSYKISAKQSYTVKILDAKNDNALLKEFNLDLTPSTSWPGNPSATVGYGSQKLLTDIFQKKQEVEEGFIKKIDADLIISALSSEIGNEITMVLHESKEKIIYITSSVKTKDDKFSRLDSALIYLELGLEEVKLNKKSGEKGNHHLENAKVQFERAHSIYIEYSKDDYINWFTIPELKNEYIFAMSSNLYLSSFLVSDFITANNLFDAINTKVKAENTGETISSLKRSFAQKTIDNMNTIRALQVREEVLQSVFKDRYGY